MAIPIAAAVAVLGAIPSITSMFGASPEFQAREVDSKWFFDTRNSIFGLVNNMSDAQRAAWESLAFHRVDFNQRRENASERAELGAFVERLQREGLGGGAPLPGIVPKVAADDRSLAFASAGMVGIPGVGRPGVIMIAIAALAAVLIWKVVR